MKESLYILLFLINVILINTDLIQTNDLQDALNKVQPGDIIELSGGIYDKEPYEFIKSGEPGNPITLRPKSKSLIQFKSDSDNCIFELDKISYINIEGSMELFNAECGIKIQDSNNIIIKRLKIHDINQHSLIVSGANIEITDNEIYNFALKSQNKRQSLTFGVYQCISVMAKTENNEFSNNITFKNNYIHDGYGEGIKFSYCEGCSAINNTIINTLSMNIYLYSSINLLIERNIIKVTNDDYNSKFGKAVGIGLSSDSLYDIESVEIQNNVIIGCRIGIYYFITGTASYKDIKIYHNTIWMVDITPIWFAEPIGAPSNSELFNNFIYHNKQSQLSPKSIWNIGYNIFYNSEKVPNQYSDTESETSKAIKKMNLSEIFNNNNGECNYNNPNINITCFRPNSKIKMNIIHGGKKLKEGKKDFEGCERNDIPSIGAFEFPEGCKGDPEPTDSPVEPDIEYNVQFKINYCVTGTQVVQIVGSLCNWNEKGGCITMQKIENCNWITMFLEGTSKFFNYKFAIFNAGKIERWEDNPNREFNGTILKDKIKKSPKGIYEACEYETSGNLVMLTCHWRAF